MPKLNIIIPLVIYPFDVMVSIGQTDKELSLELLKYGIEDISELILSETTRGRTIMFEGNQTVIRLKTFDVAVLCHECFHAVVFILSKVGIPLEVMRSDEAYAYLLEYLVGEVVKRVKNRHKCNNK